MGGVESLRLPQSTNVGHCQVKIPIREAGRYAVMSAFMLCLDIALWWILVQCFSWPYFLAASLSFSAGVLVLVGAVRHALLSCGILRHADNYFSLPAPRPHSGHPWA
jgi:hypothetical protein